MKFICNGKFFDIEDKFISYSPMLSTMLGSQIGIEMEKDAVLIDVDPIGFENYILYLSGKEFQMNEDMAIVFDFFGTSNEMQYPIDFWKVKLQDNWIRDHFYSEKLYLDPYYGLEELPIINHIPIEFSFQYGMYLAGGAALYMAGFSKKYSDFDLFFTNKKSCYQFLEKKEYPVIITENSISLNTSVKTDEIVRFGPKRGQPVYKQVNTQCILRLYKSPSEIVHGFDLDCCGILYDGKKLWCTKRTKYALENRVNWFDPKRASPSYSYRLSKYNTRGFQLKLPLITKEDIDDKKVQEYFKSILDYSIYESLDHDIDNSQINLQVMSLFINSITKYIQNIMIDFYGFMRIFGSIRNKDVPNIFGYLSLYYRMYAKYTDMQSILILSSFYNFHTSKWKVSDYDNKKERETKYSKWTGKLNQYIRNLPWKEQNPGEQLTGSFFPTPISNTHDLLDWYKQSPLLSDTPIKEEMIRIAKIENITKEMSLPPKNNHQYCPNDTNITYLYGETPDAIFIDENLQDVIKSLQFE